MKTKKQKRRGMHGMNRMNSLSLVLASLSTGCFPMVENKESAPVPTVNSVQISPEDAALEDMLTFSATVSDDQNITSMEYVFVQVNEQAYPLSLTDDFGLSGLFQADFPAELFGGGEYSATFFASDADANVSDALIETFRICSLPAVDYIATSKEPYPNDTSFSIDASISSLCPVATSLLEGDTLSAIEMTDDDEDSVYTAVLDPTTISLPEPITTFSCTVTVTDSAGQSASAASSFSIEDVVAPTIEKVTVDANPAFDNDADTIIKFTTITTDVGTGVNPETVCLELNEEGECYSLTQNKTKKKIAEYYLELTGDLFSAPETVYTLFASDYAGLETTASGTIKILNVTGLTFTDLALNPETLSNAEATPIEILADAEDATDLPEDLAVSCTLDGIDIGELTYTGSGTRYSRTLETSTLLRATDYLATNYTLACTVVDTDDNSLSETATLTITDGLAPDLSCSVTDGSNDGSASLDILCTATDETALTVVSYSSLLASGFLTNTSGDTFEGSIAVTDVAAQTYNITLIAEDATGNATEETITGTVTDALSPSISAFYTDVSSVSNNGLESFIVSAAVSDETTIDAVTVSINGTDYAMADDDGDGVYEREITPTSWEATAYPLTLFVSDGSNEATDGTSITVTDGIAPTGSCSSATGDNATDTVVSCEFSDESTASSSLAVTYSLTDIVTSAAMSYSSGSTFEATAATTGSAAGTYTGTAQATDASGNISDAASFTVTLTDALSPSISSFSTDVSSVSNNGTESFTAYAAVSDETTIDAVTVSVNGTDYAMADDDGDGVYEREITPTAWEATAYTLTLFVSDGSNESTDGTSITVTDGIAPTGSCSSATGDNATDTVVSCEFSDETTPSSSLAVAYSLTDIVTSAAMSYSSGSTFEATAATTGSPAGTYTGTAQATDGSGNISDAASFTVTLTDALSPSISAFYTDVSSVSNSGTESFTAYAAVSDETVIAAVTVSLNGTDYAMTDNDGDSIYEKEITPSAWEAKAYTLALFVSDGTNVSVDSTSITITDGYSPVITSVSAEPSTLANDGTETTIVSVCVDDDTDGAELDGTGGVQVTLDSLVESLSYNSSSGCYDSRAINGDEFSEGTYSIIAEATDAAGNTATDSSAELTITCSAATVSNITFSDSDSEVYNDSNHSDVTLSADISEGTCSASIDSVTATLYNALFNPSTRSDGHTISLSLSDGDSDGTYDSDAMTPYDDLYLGEYSAEISVTNTDGMSTAAYGSTPLTVSSICAMYGSGEILEVFVNGTSAASLNTSVDTNELAAFDIVRLGSSGTKFQHARVNYNGETVEDMDLSSCSGGTLSSYYTTSSWNNCLMEDSYDGTIASWSVAIILGGDGAPGLAVNSSATSGTGPNWFYNTGTGKYQLDDGVTGSRDNFTTTGSYITICGNP